MTGTEILTLVVQIAQMISLIAVIMVCVCRLNAVHKDTAWRIRLTYIVMGAGAFAVLISDEYTWETCFFATGIAACLITDRRRSLCYPDGIRST